MTREGHGVLDVETSLLFLSPSVICVSESGGRIMVVTLHRIHLSLLKQISRIPTSEITNFAAEPNLVTCFPARFLGLVSNE